MSQIRKNADQEGKYPIVFVRMVSNHALYAYMAHGTQDDLWIAYAELCRRYKVLKFKADKK